MEQPFAFPSRGTVVGGMLPIVRESGTAITLTVNHVGAWTRCTNASAIAFTFGALPVSYGCSGVIEQRGAGQITVSAGVGVVLVVCRGFASTLKSNAQYAPIAWMYDPQTAEYNISGDVTVT
jgi:hypothetical protein